MVKASLRRRYFRLELWCVDLEAGASSLNLGAANAKVSKA
jgi:hypothetical protein